MGFLDFLFGHRKKDSGTSVRHVPHSDITRNTQPRVEPISEPLIAPKPKPTPKPETTKVKQSPKLQPQIKNTGCKTQVENKQVIENVEPVSSTQQEVLDYLSHNPKGITFIHGKAGCGKTHLIKQIESFNYGCQVLTPTNLAASLY